MADEAYKDDEYYWIKDKKWHKWRIVQARKLALPETAGFIFYVFGNDDFIYEESDIEKSIHIPFPIE